MNIEVTTIEPGDREAWRELYNGYAEFYKVPMSDATAATVWSWLHEPTHPICGLLARQNGVAVGLAHFRDMPSPLRGATVGFLDDLFVAPAARGSGAADALLAEVSRIGKSRGWPLYRWITRDNNYRARALYDQHSTRTDWVTYQLDL